MDLDKLFKEFQEKALVNVTFDEVAMLYNDSATGYIAPHHLFPKHRRLVIELDIALKRLKHLAETTGDTAQIIFFLLGAMVIVEMISLCGGFEVIAEKIASRSKRKLLILISIITFFLSALLDNLTTAIVMYSVTCKLVDDETDRMTFAGVIVIAANAGGAWFPTGDVTTTMIWIEGKVTTLSLVKHLFIPSVISLLVPLLWVLKSVTGSLPKRATSTTETPKGANIILGVGLSGLVSVPLLKASFHLPPYLCMLGAVGVLWAVEEIVYKGKAWITVSQSEDMDGTVEHGNNKKTLAKALESVEIPSLLFFAGILLAVSALQSANLLQRGAATLSHYCSPNTVVTVMGLASALLDNVPLTAALLKMYASIPPDSRFWLMLTLCVGTGGSLLIIGSAAGVVLMGKARITFGWYLRRFTLSVFIGYCASSLVLFLS